MRLRLLILAPLVGACADPVSAPLALEPTTAPSRFTVDDLEGQPASWTRTLDVHRPDRKRELDVRVPELADHAIEIRSPHGVGTRVTLEDALPIAAVVRDSAALYAAAGPRDAHVARWLHGRGVEEVLVYRNRPAIERATWRLQLESVAGLRLISGALELLDDTGTPRIRMSPPEVLDRNGTRHSSEVRVIGCAVDTDPRGPWGRRTTDPGASECRFELSWSLPADAYPAIVDPYWSDAEGELVLPRAGHSATKLQDGRVLVVGGRATPAAELFDPATETFTLTSSLSVESRLHQAVLLTDNRVVVTGGENGPVVANLLSRVERFDPTTADWESLPDLNLPHTSHTVTRLQDGSLLVAGSFDYVEPQKASAAVEICNSTGEDCQLVAPMGRARAAHSATLLADGRVLVMGGGNAIMGDGPFWTDIEVYDPMADGWTIVQEVELDPPRVNPQVVPLKDGRLLVVGGSSQAQGDKKETRLRLLDVSKVPWSWQDTEHLLFDRWLHRATMVPNGRVLVTGNGGKGFGPSGVDDTELIAPDGSQSLPSGQLAEPVFFHTSTLLDDGRVLVAGGRTALMPDDEKLAMLFGTKFGEPCDAADETICANGYCVDGICRGEPEAPGTGGAGGSGGGAATSAGTGGTAGGALATDDDDGATSFLACSAPARATSGRTSVAWLLCASVALLAARRRRASR